MKKALLLFGTLFLATVTFNSTAQTMDKVGGPEITFNKETHDYGQVEFNGDGTCEFKFTNTGNEPLIISNARGSCGCTVPNWPKEPIAPGQSGVIKVKYDTKRTGAINKTVSVTSNAVNEPNKTLRIKGTVAAAPTAPTRTPVAPQAN